MQAPAASLTAIRILEAGDETEIGAADSGKPTLSFWEEIKTMNNRNNKESLARRLATTSSVTYLDGPNGVTEKIKRAMYDVARQFVYIGFLLYEVQEYRYYLEKGYESVYEYAETELGFKRSSTKNFIAINYEFGCRNGRETGGIAHQRTISLQSQYEQFNYSQLCEM